MFKNLPGCDAMGLAVYERPKIVHAVVQGEKYENVNSAVQNASGRSETVQNRCLLVEEHRWGDIESMNVKINRKYNKISGKCNLGHKN